MNSKNKKRVNENMPLIVDYESEDYQFYKTLNEDVQLKPDEYNRYDIQIINGDYVNVSGSSSLVNAIIIAIMTRYQELSMSLYSGFGCRVHELIKKNKSEMTRYEIMLFVEDVLNNMRRIKSVNFIEVLDSENLEYHVEFSVTAINDELVSGSVEI